MMEKRMRKVDGILRELPAPELQGPAEADVTLVGWGSTQGLIREAVALLAEEGHHRQPSADQISGAIPCG